MTAFRVAPAASLALAAFVAAGCTSFYEIGIETPIQPKLDVSGFQRVLVVGFIGGGTGEVDANMETVRLLRKSSTVTVARGTVAPEGSVTEPVIAPVGSWPRASMQAVRRRVQGQDPIVRTMAGSARLSVTLCRAQ